MDSITFNCPYCRQIIEAPAEAAGIAGECPFCEKEVVAPALNGGSLGADGAANGITFNCPQCGQTIEAPAEVAGTVGECPFCEKEIVAPSAVVGKAEQRDPTVQLITTQDCLFSCPYCEECFEAAPDAAGSLVDCPNCQKAIEIPTLAIEPVQPLATRPATTQNGQQKMTYHRPTPESAQRPLKTIKKAGNVRKHIKFSCPYCGQHLEAPIDMIGESIDCPNCKKPMKVHRQVSSKALHMARPLRRP